MKSKTPAGVQISRRELLWTLALVPVAAACGGDKASTGSATDAGSGTDVGSADAATPGACTAVGQGAQISHGPFSGAATSDRKSTRLNSSHT